MAALELHDTEGPVLRENVTKAIAGLEQPLQKVRCTLSVVTSSWARSQGGFQFVLWWYRDLLAQHRFLMLKFSMKFFHSTGFYTKVFSGKSC